MDKFEPEYTRTREDMRTCLLDLFQSGVHAVKGAAAVQTWLSQNTIETPTHILSVGKASVSMFEGLPQDWKNTVQSVVITKTDHIGETVLSDNVVAFEASHPVPDQTSLEAGDYAVEFVKKTDRDSRLLILVSGGASSLVESLKDGITYNDLVALTQGALGDGLDIAEINRRRNEISAIKGGQLLSYFNGSHIDVLAISDVEGDSIGVIGSGIGSCPKDPSFTYNGKVIASNAVARQAVSDLAQNQGMEVILNKESMYADVMTVAKEIADELMIGPDGLYIYGGEPTVNLPDEPGHGGRNQALALEIARHIQDRDDLFGLVAGTDGTDGPTPAAGGFLNGTTFMQAPGAQEALDKADSGRYLARTGDQIITGPTGTNVMDLAIFLKNTVERIKL